MGKSLTALVLGIAGLAGCSYETRGNSTFLPEATKPAQAPTYLVPDDSKERDTVDEEILKNRAKDFFEFLARVTYFDSAEILGSESAVIRHPAIAEAAISARINDIYSKDTVALEEMMEREITDKEAFRICQWIVQNYREGKNSLRRTSSIYVGALGEKMPYWRMNKRGRIEYLRKTIDIQAKDKQVGIYFYFNPKIERYNEETGKVLEIQRQGNEN